MIISIIYACDNNNGISKNNKIPWKNEEFFKNDINFFKKITTTGTNPAVVMGSHTYLNIGSPLKNRINIILSKTFKPVSEDILCFNNIDDILIFANKSNISHLYIIGGKYIYDLFYNLNIYDFIYKTTIHNNYNCDNQFIINHNNSSLKLDEIIISNNTYKIEKFKHVNSDELQYIELIKKTITSQLRKSRNGNVFSIFGNTMEFDLKNNTFPLLTTKKMFVKGIIEELLWFLSGSTDSKILENKGINIWKGNSSRQFLDSVNLQHYNEGDIGPMYGFQWRHFGANYPLSNDPNEYKGIDQIKTIIDQLTNDPYSRRIILTTWNPTDLHKMCINPCHIFAQFYVNNGHLSCQMYQRSGDIGLGIPFNISSYSLLTILLAHYTNLIPDKFIHVLGDAHVYEEHLEPLQQQILNNPYPFPKLYINKSNPNFFTNPINYDDISIKYYRSYEKINMIFKE